MRRDYLGYLEGHFSGTGRCASPDPAQPETSGRILLRRLNAGPQVDRRKPERTPLLGPDGSLGRLAADDCGERNEQPCRLRDHPSMFVSLKSRMCHEGPSTSPGTTSQAISRGHICQHDVGPLGSNGFLCAPTTKRTEDPFFQVFAFSHLLGDPSLPFRACLLTLSSDSSREPGGLRCALFTKLARWAGL